MLPRLLSNDELEREARSRADPLLEEAVRRLIDGEHEPTSLDSEVATLEYELSSAETRAEEAEGEAEELRKVCDEAAETLRNADPNKWCDLIQKLEDA